MSAAASPPRASSGFMAPSPCHALPALHGVLPSSLCHGRRQLPFISVRASATGSASSSHHDNSQQQQQQQQRPQPPQGQQIQQQRQEPPVAPGHISSLLDYWDPFNLGTRSLRQIVGTMDKLLDASSLVTLPQDAVPRPYGRLPWDIIEAEDCYHMRIDLPGFNRDEVKVRVEENNNVFSVDAEHREENKDKWRTRSHGRCRTRIALPDGVNASGISARLDNGVLDVSIPKLKKEKKVLDVKVE